MRMLNWKTVQKQCRQFCTWPSSDATYQVQAKNIGKYWGYWGIFENVIGYTNIKLENSTEAVQTI